MEAASALLPGRSNATKNRNIIGPAAAVLHYAHEQRWCAYTRFRRFPVSRRSTRQPVPDVVMTRLLAATEGHQKLFLAMLYETGLRVTDLLRLDESNLDLPGGAIVARVAKTDERIRLGISPGIIAMLEGEECPCLPLGRPP